MIRINLLPVRSAKKRESGQKQVFLLAVAIALGLGASIVLGNTIVNPLSRIQHRMRA